MRSTTHYRKEVGFRYRMKRMKKKIQFPQLGGLMHGGDYNPEQWLDRPDILEEDVRLMRKAGINCATLGVFSWFIYEPNEGEFHFEWLHQIMDRLYENGIYTILATPSGARPVWLDERYPEAMRVNAMGVRNHHGVRHNHCMSSPKYREKVRIIDEHLAEEFGTHPGLLLWHISNELGGECYCELCQKRFQDWLRERYDNDIEKLNHAWWTTFWSHPYQRFDQIEPPLANGEGSMMGLNLDWKRFTTWNMTDYMKTEIAVLKEKTPDIPVTANFMKLYNGLDYHVMEKELDIISWDSYPRYHNNWESLYDTAVENAFDHAVMRGLKRDQPFMLMESTPSLVNWHPVNTLKRPGVHALSCLQAVACGSDTVQYFQWRKGRGAFEQYHGAVVDHLGTSNTRVFREVSAVGEMLKTLSPVTGSLVTAQTAILFDWENRWAIQDMKAGSQETKKYEETCLEQYRILMKMGVEADIVNPMDDLSRYSVVLAPMLYLLKPGCAEHLKQYVEHGGILIASYLTGYVNEQTLCYLGGFPGDGLQELFGLYAEELDTLYPGQTNQVVFRNGNRFQVTDYAEILQVKDACVEACYDADFYQGTPAVTRKDYGNGTAWYLGARIDSAGLEAVYRRIMTQAQVPIQALPHGVEYHKRIADGVSYAFYLNQSEQPQELLDVYGHELLQNQEVEGLLKLEPYGMAVVQTNEQS